MTFCELESVEFEILAVPSWEILAFQNFGQKMENRTKILYFKILSILFYSHLFVFRAILRCYWVVLDGMVINLAQNSLHGGNQALEKVGTP